MSPCAGLSSLQPTPSIHRLSREHSNRELQHVVISQAGEASDTKLANAAASATVVGEEASKLSAGQRAAMPAALSTEAAASAVVGTGAGATRRRGWFGRARKGEGVDGKAGAAVEQSDSEDKPKEQPVKVSVGSRSSKL